MAAKLSPQAWSALRYLRLEPDYSRPELMAGGPLNIAEPVDYRGGLAELEGLGLATQTDEEWAATDAGLLHVR